MKEVCLKFQTNGKEVEELFNFILRRSNYNLNQYVKGDSLSIPNDMEEEFVTSLKKMLDILPEVVKVIKDKDKFWNIFNELERFEDNDKFIKWLIKYVENAVRPFEDASFLREIQEETLCKMIDYCFENLIVKNVGKNEVRRSGWDVEQMGIMRRIIFTFVDMVICENFTEEKTYEQMNRMFCLEASFCIKLWELVERNRNELWGIMVLRKIQRLEEKLDRLLAVIED